jgi:hypothetical protein
MEKDNLNLQMFINIRKSKLYKMETHTAVFPCVKAISLIVRHANMETRYILHSKIHPITFFKDFIITSYYHLEDEEKLLDEKLIKKFSHKPKEILKA